VLAGGHGQFARRGRALAVPVGQQEVGQRLVVAHQHFGGRQDQLAKGVQVGLQLVFVQPAQVGQVADQRHVGVVGQDLGHRADGLGAAQEADLPAGDGHVLQDGARLLDHGVGVDRVLVEDLGGVAHHDGGDHRQGVRTHRGDGGDVAGQAAGAAGVAGVEAHHAGRGRRLCMGASGSGPVSGSGAHGLARSGGCRAREGASARRCRAEPLAEREELCRRCSQILAFPANSRGYNRVHCSDDCLTVSEPRTWMCLICGWIYDEAAGDPDHGIPPAPPGPTCR
jgi:hypothetical protein